MRLPVILLLGTAVLTKAQSLVLRPTPTQGVQACSATLSIELAPAGGPRPSGLQWTLRYPPGVVSGIWLSPGPAAVAAAKDRLLCTVQPGSTTCILLGRNINPIPAGTLAVATLQLSPEATIGDSPIEVTDAIAVAADASVIPISGATALLTIQQAVQPWPAISATGVVNAASLVNGPLAPGELISIFGCGLGPPQGAITNLASAKLDTVLAGTSVLFDGIPGPLFYAGNDQINAMVPYEISGQDHTNLQVMYLGQPSIPLPLAAAEASPAVFAADNSGTGPGVILDTNGLRIGAANPAVPGSVIAFYGTGLGQTNPTSDSTSVCPGNPPAPVSAVSVLIGGLTAKVLYAGCSRGSVPGLLQVNARVPETLGPGTWPVQLTVGAISSPAAVTLTVGAK